MALNQMSLFILPLEIVSWPKGLRSQNDWFIIKLCEMWLKARLSPSVWEVFKFVKSISVKLTFE